MAEVPGPRASDPEAPGAEASVAASPWPTAGEWLAAALLTLWLLGAARPGAFILDDNNYLATLSALRAGGLHTPGTEGLTPGKGLRWYDPVKLSTPPSSTPVYPVTPPLWAPLALPASLLGWRGLVGLNSLAFVATALLVLGRVRAVTASTFAARVAAASFVVGSFNLEYALGIWPHMLTNLLLMLGYVVVAGALGPRPAPEGQGPDRGPPPRRLAVFFAAGLSLGLAAGVRYPAILVGAMLGLALALAEARDWRAGAPGAGRRALALGAGLALPLATAAAINQVRLGVAHPLSKGSSYLKPKRLTRPGSPHPQGALARTVEGFLGRVLDFRAHGPPAPSWLEKHPWAHYVVPARSMLIELLPKRSLAASAPWTCLVLFGLLPWALARRVGGARGREAALVAAVVLPWLAVFSFFGLKRHDGLCFNQRYLLEVIPVFSVGLGLALHAGAAACPRALAAGAALGWWISRLFRTVWTPEFYLKLVHGVPHLLWVAALLAWATHRPRALTAVVGACLVYAWVQHVEIDLMGSRRRRQVNATRQAAFGAHLPPRAALMIYGGAVDSVGTLVLDHDLVVIDLHPDHGATASTWIDELEAQGRPVFVYQDWADPDLTARILDGRTAEDLGPIPAPHPGRLLKVGPRPPSG